MEGAIIGSGLESGGPAYGKDEKLGHTSVEDGEWGELFKMFNQKKRKNKGHLSSYGNALEVTTFTQALETLG